MLRVAARRLSSFCSAQPSWRPNQAASAIVSWNPINGGASSSSDEFKLRALNDYFSFSPQFHVPHRGARLLCLVRQGAHLLHVRSLADAQLHSGNEAAALCAWSLRLI